MANEKSMTKQTELTHELVGFFKDKNGHFNTVVVKYNPVTNEFGKLETENVGNIRIDAEFAFKVNAGKRMDINFELEKKQ